MRQSAYTSVLRLLLVLSLAFSPLAQPLALAALPDAPAEQADAVCPHHAAPAGQPDSPPADPPGQCCHLKGVPCHCAMALALPTPDLPAPPAQASEHPTSAVLLVSALTPPPEPPPPRD